MSNAEVSYGRRLGEIAAVRPDDADLLLVDREGTEVPVRWRELEVRSNQIAQALADLGVTADSVVALALPSCVEHVFVTLAVWRLGAALLPLRHDLPAWEMERLLGTASPAVLVSDDHHADVPVLTRADLAKTAALEWRALEDRIAESTHILASSGSTGRPKLIITPARGVLEGDAQSTLVKGGLGAVTALVTSPLYHVNGFAFTAPALLEGARVVVMTKFDAQLAVDLIAKHQVTFTVMVPTMLQRIARLDTVRADQLASLQRVIYGGSTIPEWVVDRWLELIPPDRFVFTYGSSERLGLFSMTGAQWKEHRGATGMPVDVDVKILDEERNEVAAGEVGEIYMRPLTSQPRFRYLGMPMPEPTPDGYLSIGDLGRLDADGYLYIADRRKDMIISGGVNVFPAEVEAALSEHPGVHDQVVVGVPDDEWGHRVHAIVAPHDPAHAPTVEELREHCRSRLAFYKVPKTYEIVDALPRTEAGKLNRTALAAERAAQQLPRGSEHG